MSRAQQLYELQLVDLEIDARTESLARIEEQLRTPQWLVEAQEKGQRLNAQGSDLERRQRSLEWAADDVRAKVADLEEKLYSGRIRNPKELSGLQQEADALARKRGAVEDSLLELMLELETLQQETSAAGQELDRLEAQWRHEREQMGAEQQRLNDELESMTGKREALVCRLPEADYRLYTVIKQERGGRAVVKVERSMCQGCRITMSSVEIQRARTSSEPVRCGSCGRLLYVA